MTENEKKALHEADLIIKKFKHLFCPPMYTWKRSDNYHSSHYYANMPKVAQPTTAINGTKSTKGETKGVQAMQVQPKQLNLFQEVTGAPSIVPCRQLIQSACSLSLCSNKEFCEARGKCMHGKSSKGSENFGSHVYNGR